MARSEHSRIVGVKAKRVSSTVAVAKHRRCRWLPAELSHVTAINVGNGRRRRIGGKVRCQQFASVRQVGCAGQVKRGVGRAVPRNAAVGYGLQRGKVAVCVPPRMAAIVPTPMPRWFSIARLTSPSLPLSAITKI